MSKILPASCSASSVVTVEGKGVTSIILSAGKKSSTGVVLLEEGVSTYVTSNATDIHDLIATTNELIQKLQDVFTQTIVALSALDAVTTSPGSASAAIALVTTKNILVTTANAQYVLTKDLLK